MQTLITRYKDNISFSFSKWRGMHEKIVSYQPLCVPLHIWLHQYILKTYSQKTHTRDFVNISWRDATTTIGRAFVTLYLVFIKKKINTYTTKISNGLRQYILKLHGSSHWSVLCECVCIYVVLGVSKKDKMMNT